MEKNKFNFIDIASICRQLFYIILKFSINRNISLHDVFIMNYGYVNYLVLMLSTFVNWLFTSFKNKASFYFRLEISILIIICALIFQANTGYLLDEYPGLVRGGLDLISTWHILILSFIKVFQLLKSKS